MFLQHTIIENNKSMNNGSTLKTYKHVSTTHNYWENNKLTMNNGSTLKTLKTMQNNKLTMNLVQR